MINQKIRQKTNKSDKKKLYKDKTRKNSILQKMLSGMPHKNKNLHLMHGEWKKFLFLNVLCINKYNVSSNKEEINQKVCGVGKPFFYDNLLVKVKKK